MQDGSDGHLRGGIPPAVPAHHRGNRAGARLRPLWIGWLHRYFTMSATRSCPRSTHSADRTSPASDVH
jgi:hypothetical protein